MIVFSVSVLPTHYVLCFTITMISLNVSFLLKTHLSANPMY